MTIVESTRMMIRTIGRWLVLASLSVTSLLHAQVGGIDIDVDGVMRAIEGAKRRGRTEVPEISEDLARPADERVVSLRGVSEQLKGCLEAETPIPDELRYLAGLVALEEIELVPARQDVLLRGPAEGWMILPDGRVVGRESRRAVMHLEDLAVALRSVLNGSGEIRCSIDPTAKGLAAARSVSFEGSTAKRGGIRYAEQLEEALGLQKVSTSGVPPQSRFARVMVEADYLMKRMAIGDIKLRGVTSHLDAVAKRMLNQQLGGDLSRWWFTSAYQPLIADEALLRYRIEGPRMKVLNEEMWVDERGRRSGKGDDSKADAFSREFTALLPEIDTKYPVFSDLRNLYDLVLLGALIQSRSAAGWLEGSPLLDESAWEIPTEVVPTQAEAVAAFVVRRGKRPDGILGPILCVSYGGVSIRSRELVAFAKPGPPKSGGGPSSPAVTALKPSLPSTVMASGRWWEDASEKKENQADETQPEEKAAPEQRE